MTAPWQPYIEHQPISSAGISLVEAFGKMINLQWELHAVDLFEALSESEVTPEGEIPVSAIVQMGARTFQAAILEGKLQTSARPLEGGAPIDLKQLHWEIDNPVPRMASGCLNLKDWPNVLAEPSHRIFVNRKDFDRFLASLMTQDEIYQAVDGKLQPAKSVPRAPAAASIKASACHDALSGSVVHDKPLEDQKNGLQKIMPENKVEDFILRRPEVIKRVAVSSSTLDNMVRAGTFPPPVQINTRAVGWYMSQITEWMEQRAKVGRVGVS